MIKTQKLKLWQNLKNLNVTKLKNLNFKKNSNCDKTQKLKLWQNFSKLWQNLNNDKYQFMIRKTILKGSFSKNILTPWQLMWCSLGSVLRFSQCFKRNSFQTKKNPFLNTHYVKALNIFREIITLLYGGVYYGWGKNGAICNKLCKKIHFYRESISLKLGLYI